MRIFSYLFLGIVLILCVSFASLNASVVTFNYYFGKAHYSLAILLAIAWLIGVLFGLLIAFKVWLRSKTECQKLRKKLKVSESKASQSKEV